MAESESPLEVDINIRVSAGMKAAVKRIAKKRHTDVSHLVRPYLAKILVEDFGCTEEELSLTLKDLSSNPLDVKSVARAEEEKALDKTHRKQSSGK